MKGKLKIVQILIALCALVTFSCGDFPFREDTAYFTIDGELLPEFYDVDEENNNIVDVKEIDKTLKKQTTNEIWDFKKFKASAPDNYFFREAATGTYKINLGDFKVDSDVPNFNRIEVTDINIGDMVFMDVANFFYMPVKDSAAITIEGVIEHIKADISSKRVYYTDNKNSVIYGDSENFSVIHIKYLASLETIEIFVSDQKSGPFSDVTSRDLFAMALSKLRMAKRFHTINNDIDEDENSRHVIPTLSRYHRKLANIIFYNIKELPSTVPDKKKLEIDAPDFSLRINVDRRQKNDTIYRDFKILKKSDTVSIGNNSSLQKTTVDFLRSLFEGSTINVLAKDKRMFLLSDGQTTKIVLFYKAKKKFMMLYFSHHYDRYEEEEDNMDVYFEIFKNIDKELDVFY